MKIAIHQMLGTNFSWALVGQNLGRSLLQLGHQVEFKSTNGYQHFPKDLQPFINEKMDQVYDMTLSYTALHNFRHYCQHSKKNRFGIWNYEWDYLPLGLAKNYQSVDLVLPSSSFSEEIFKNNGIPKSHLQLVHHGINLTDYQNQVKLPIKTKKKIKILCVYGQMHLRKNLPGILESFGQAFTKNDDVCLVLKITKKKSSEIFELGSSFDEIYTNWKKKFPNHAEVELIYGFVDNVIELYNACDIVYCLGHGEAFNLVALEGLACHKVVLAPRHGGQLDFMNDYNSILIDGLLGKADKKSMYWNYNPKASQFNPNIEDATKKLQLAVKNYDQYLEKFIPEIDKILINFQWSKIANQIVNLCK